MEKYHAIPEGYMRVGELAKKTGTTARTLRHYDEIGLLSPSMESEGGYRLYNDKDMVLLIQIQTMKRLGFTLSEIKKRLVSLDTPDDMVNTLTEHETAIQNKLEALSESLETIRVLKAEVIQMKTMDFKKYADILMSLQMKSVNYWAIRYMDDDVLEHFRNHFDEESAMAFVEAMNHFEAEVAQFQNEGVTPESERGQNLAKVVLQKIHEVTNGDEVLLLKFAKSIAETVQKIKVLDEERSEKFVAVHNFVRAAMDAYFIKMGHDPHE